jgi:hypothetical protein
MAILLASSILLLWKFTALALVLLSSSAAAAAAVTWRDSSSSLCCCCGWSWRNKAESAPVLRAAVTKDVAKGVRLTLKALVVAASTRAKVMRQLDVVNFMVIIGRIFRNDNMREQRSVRRSFKKTVKDIDRRKKQTAFFESLPPIEIK